MTGEWQGIIYIAPVIVDAEWLSVENDDNNRVPFESRLGIVFWKWPTLNIITACNITFNWCGFRIDEFAMQLDIE